MNHIVKGCLRGDHKSQCEAYRLLWSVIYPTVYQVLRNREESEDVMQESIIHGFNRLRELKEPRKYIAWQKQISLRSALNRLRANKNVLRLFDAVDIPEEEPAEIDIMQMDGSSVYDALETMPEGYRLVIRLHLMEGMPHDEIGEALGISASTSRSQYSRAIMKLRKLLIETYEKQI